MLNINHHIIIQDKEIELTPMRSQGAGGQHVNKVSSAIHLRFDIKNSSLAEVYKQRLLALDDSRINKDGVIIIKAQEYRSQIKNREQAILRLKEIITSVLTTPKFRKPTKPTRSSQKRRLDGKTKQAQKKETRNKSKNWSE